MAENEDGQERTEEPTSRRLQQSRDKGQVARSRELNILLSLLSAGVGLLFLGEPLAQGLIDNFRTGLQLDPAAGFDHGLAIQLFNQSMLSFLWVLLPFFALMTVGAFIGPLVMGGWSFSLQAITPKLEKVDPLSGMKRIFSLKSLLELLKSLLKFVIILIAAYFFFVAFLDDILVLGKYQPILGIAKATHLLVWGLILLSSSLLFVVFFDVPFQLWDHTRQLRMTRQEVRDEMKETDGRPEVKSRIRNLQREISQRRMMADVPTADVIITNPTHYAVALKYHKNKGSAPIVVAKGQGLVALKIRSLGLENAVPICEVPALARALYGFVDIGAEIPQNLYLAVAKVLAYVYQLRSGQSPIITMPEEITVPDDYAWTPPQDEGASA